MNLIVASAVRLLLVLIGAITGTSGWWSEETVEVVTGIIVLMIPVVWTFWEKIKLARVGVTSVGAAERRVEPRTDIPVVTTSKDETK